MFFLTALLINFTPQPICLDANNQYLGVNNDQVISWKYSTENQYTNRGHIQGIVGRKYPSKNGHNHFQAIINGDSIEVIYNDSFGKLPEIAQGDEVEACGDFINSNKNVPSYPASPDGAIVHWVHESTGRHLSGFVKINEKFYGQIH